MRTLAIETATEACSIALFEGAELLANEHVELGRGHAERLVPMIAALPNKGKAERILVSLGPGSFTGVRIGIATARALGIAWGAEVLGYRTLSLVARSDRKLVATGAGSQGADGSGQSLVCMNGGHGEWFVQAFDHDGRPLGAEQSLPPELASERFDQQFVIGSRAEEFVSRRGYGDALTTLPDARNAIRLHEEELSQDLSPIYGRGPDAKLPGK